MRRLLHFLCFVMAMLLLSLPSFARTVIAIDAGHGGKDPGAIGKTFGLKEKEVTLSIARQLKALLDADPNFKAVMTRNGDYFIQLPNRTEIARRHKANYLISIHADSSPSSANLKGASVWVLSNRRANDELGKWLEDHEKQSELLGGAGSVLSNNNERYLNQTVLDLQFSHAQRTGYELGRTVLSRMGNVTLLAKRVPQHASLSVLRSPDIPSVLVETGFLSNTEEERKLATQAYRRQIARAIYNGLVAYRNKYPTSASKVAYKAVKESPKSEKNLIQKIENEAEMKKAEGKKEETKTEKAQNTKTAVKAFEKSGNTEKVKTDKANTEKTAKAVNPNATYHIVQQDETLYSIARMYKTTPEKLSKLNNIQHNKIIVGKKLKLK